MDGGRAVPGWDGHLLLLHDTEAERIAAVTAWVRRGLDRGEKVLYGDTSDGSSWLLTALDLDGVDVAAVTDDRRLEVVAVDAFCPEGGQDTVVDRALTDGFPAVRMSVESPALTILSPEQWLAAERTMDRIVRSRPVSALCQYRRPTADGVALNDTVAVHLDGVRAPMLVTTPHEDGVSLHGEIDIENAEVLGLILRAAVRTGPRTLWLDFAEVSFVDAAACRRLVQETAEYRRDGGLVVLAYPLPVVEHTLRLLGIGDVPGMALVNDGP